MLCQSCLSRRTPAACIRLSIRAMLPIDVSHDVTVRHVAFAADGLRSASCAFALPRRVPLVNALLELVVVRPTILDVIDAWKRNSK
jgi:hypothetical protein